MNILIDGMSRDDDIQLSQTAYAYYLALVANPSLTDESWKKSSKNALESFNNIVNILHPWSAQETSQRRDNEISQMKEQFKKIIGDPDDPEFKRQLAKELREWYTPQAPVETDDEKINRRFRELKKT